MAESATVDLPDVEPLPGKATSWAKGEPIPKDMPAADTSTTGGAATATKALAGLQHEKIAAEEKVFGGIEKSADEATALARKAYEEEGASAHDPALRPWNEKEEQAKHQTDPIQAFGSLGSVFGIIASSFTNAPFTNSLNASAAAIEAIKKGDRQGYEDARKAWEDNYKLALERHKIQHEHYQDAVALMRTNLAAGEAKMRVLAARFGDRQTATLLDAGMSKEVIELQAARQTLADKMALNRDKVFKANAEIGSLLAKGYDPNNPQSEKSQKAYAAWREEQAKFKAMEHPSLFGGQQNLTLDRQIAAATAAKKLELKSQHPEWGEDKLNEAAMDYARHLKQKASPITANRADVLKGKIGQVDLAEKDILDNLDALLLKHNFITGIGGILTRAPEIISNFLGSHETDRRQFLRFVDELRLIAPRILLDTHGRPISAEAERINTIIAGISPGDTGPNTIRAYAELRKQFDHIRQRLQERLGEVAPESTTAKPKPSGSDDWYKSSPLVH